MSETFLSDIDQPSYEQVAALDPLRLDTVIEYLPKMNADADTEAIFETTGYATNNAAELNIPSRSTALAAIRDLDFLASSLLRHGISPLDAIPGLEEQFVRLGAVADTVPRGTVFTYAAANPTGDRRRSFTGTMEEDAFIEAVTAGVVSLDTAVEAMGQTDLNDEAAMIDALTQSSEAMDTMVASIVNVQRVVSPEFFTFQMRPFFEPLVINGKSLTGAGGAQMQLIAVDRMLWGFEEKDPMYEGFFAENWQYLTPKQQGAVSSYVKQNDEVSIVRWLQESSDASNETRDATLTLLKKIKKFRYPHRKVARDNFKLRSDDAVGSGTYTPDILDLLIEKTGDAIDQVEEAYV